MKLLWITNIKVAYEDMESSSGGWMFGALEYLSDNTDYEIIIAYPNGEKKNDSIRPQIKYTTFHYNTSKTKYDENLCDQFISIYTDYQPDLIHIWGTERLHTYAAVQAAEKMQIVDKVVISIQGLVSVLWKHYTLGIPVKYQGTKTLLDMATGGSVKAQQKKYHRRGIYEQLALKTAKNVIGRTPWDKACVQQINPDIRYFYCDEILRSEFYSSDQWKYLKCEHHSIFLSQASYPIKGFHFVLEALMIVKSKYPDVKVYVAGENIFGKKGGMTFINRNIRISTYKKYLYQKIVQYGLQENIVFLGRLNAIQMKEQYLKTNVFVNASTVENACNSIMEAMRLGVPVVSSYVGGITDTIDPQINGIAYPCDEPYMLAYYIMEIFQDINLAERISCNAREKAMRRYDPKKVGKEMVSIYESLKK